MQNLKVSLIQSALYWEDPKANQEMLWKKVIDLPDDVDVIVLPEMFTTGFSMAVDKLAEKMNGPAMQWMKKIADLKDAVVMGSLIIREENCFFNRLIWMYPGGKFLYYDKRHLFVMAKEDRYFTRGNNKVIAVWRGWKICPMICFDLRFPAFVRNQENYDALICVANWPEKRSKHWRILLPARAVENQCYVAAVNRVGKDGNNIEYRGDSCIIDPSGEKLLTAAWEENILTVVLNKDKIKTVRRHMPFLPERDDYTIDLSNNNQT